MGSFEPGQQLTPSLRLVRSLGAGGMGAVWIADHSGLRTQVVVKLMSEELVASPDALARFSREAAAAALVKSPHVVHMIDHGVLADGVPYIAMELMDGEDVASRIARDGSLPPRQVATLLNQVAKALARAQERGVVHRDIKPDNIFLSDGGGGEAFVKVLDFGIAKLGEGQQLSQTKTGATIGTPYYMSPEQMMGLKEIDWRTDLWALGVVAFEALTGKRPFQGDSVGALAVAICTSPLPSPSSVLPSLPPEVDAWFARACAREPAARFGSAKELADAFQAAVGGTEPVPFVRGHAEDMALAPTAVPEAPPAVSAKSRSTTTGPVSDAREDAARPRPARRGALLGAALFVVLGAAFFVWRAGGARHEEARPAATAVDPPRLLPVASSAPATTIPAPSAAAAVSASPSALASAPSPPVRLKPAHSASSKPAPAATDPFGTGSK